MSDDSYAHFADRYDLFINRSDKLDLVRTEFFRKLLLENDVHSVLDCACGTGRDLIMFSSLGLSVYGSNISEAMLAQARKNLDKEKLEIPPHSMSKCNS